MNQYRFAEDANAIPYVSYDKYADHQTRFEFNKIPRNIFQYDICQCAWLKVDTKYIHLYSVGPLFLPIVPVFPFNSEPTIDPESMLQIQLWAYSPLEFNDSIKTLPDLTIETPKGILKPTVKPSKFSDIRKTFFYPVKVSETPWFIVHEAEILLESGQTLKIPRTKYEMKREVEFLWVMPIAP